MSKKAKTRTQKKTPVKPAATRAVVYLVGDAENVAEYSALCAKRGYAVVFDWNEVPDPLRFEAGAMRRQKSVPQGASFALELTNVDLDRKRKNLENLDRALPPSIAIVSTSLTVTATEQSGWVRNKARLVGCSILPTFAEKAIVEIAPTVFSPPATVQVVQKFFHSLGKEIELVQDRVGMVFPRILCRMINEAAFALQEEIATPQDLDIAMKVGANHPFGPIEWAERIGLNQIVAVLAAIERETGEERVRIAPLLRQMAIGGSWWHRRHGTN